MTLSTDFCVVGFPKCGTTALARFLEASPHLKLAKLDGSYEAPFYSRGVSTDQGYEKGVKNGHKFSAYAYDPKVVAEIVRANPRVLLIFCVRDAHTALLSWRRMHQRIAEKNRPAGHFVNKNKKSKAFYATASVEDYFWKFAKNRLEYARHIKKVLTRVSPHDYVVVSQSRMAGDLKAVIQAIHAKLGVEASREYLDGLPAAHASLGDEELKAAEFSPALSADLIAKNRRLVKLIDRLDDDKNLTARQPASFF